MSPLLPTHVSRAGEVIVLRAREIPLEVLGGHLNLIFSSNGGIEELWVSGRTQSIGGQGGKIRAERNGE